MRLDQWLTGRRHGRASSQGHFQEAPRQLSEGAYPRQNNRFASYASAEDFVREELFSAEAYVQALNRKGQCLDSKEDPWQHFVGVGQYMGYEWTTFFSPSFARRYMECEGRDSDRDIFEIWEEGNLAVPLTPYLDPSWYLLGNRDVLEAGFDPLVHWTLWGAQEGRSPAPFVSARGWIDQDLLRVASTDADTDAAWEFNTLSLAALSEAFDIQDLLTANLDGRISFCTSPETVFGDLRKLVKADRRILYSLFLSETEVSPS